MILKYTSSFSWSRLENIRTNICTSPWPLEPFWAVDKNFDFRTIVGSWWHHDFLLQGGGMKANFDKWIFDNS